MKKTKIYGIVEVTGGSDKIIAVSKDKELIQKKVSAEVKYRWDIYRRWHTFETELWE